MLMPTRLWPWCVLSVLPAHVAISLPAGVPWTALFGLYFTNTAQAVLGAALFRDLHRPSRHRKRPRFAPSPSSRAASSYRRSSSPLPTWRSPSGLDGRPTPIGKPGHCVSCRTRLPPPSSCHRSSPPPSSIENGEIRSPKRFLEAALLALSVVSLASFAFLGGASFTTGLPLLFCAYLPLLLWAAMRLARPAPAGHCWALPLPP